MEKNRNSARPTRFSSRDKADRVQHTAVEAVVAVVAHGEHVAIRHHVFLGVVERPVIPGLEDVVLHAVRQRLTKELHHHRRPVPGRGVVALELACHFGAVDEEQCPFFIWMPVAGQTDDPLDVVDAGVARQLEDGDVTAAWAGCRGCARRTAAVTAGSEKRE